LPETILLYIYKNMAMRITITGIIRPFTHPKTPMASVKKKEFPICIITAINETRNTGMAHFLFNKRKIQPKRPENTAMAKTPVIQAGALSINANCSSLNSARKDSVL